MASRPPLTNRVGIKKGEPRGSPFFIPTRFVKGGREAISYSTPSAMRLKERIIFVDRGGTSQPLRLIDRRMETARTSISSLEKRFSTNAVISTIVFSILSMSIAIE